MATIDLKQGDSTAGLQVCPTAQPGVVSIRVTGAQAAAAKGSALAAADVFGEFAFLTGSQRTATVRATGSAVEVVELDEQSLRSLLEDQHELAEELAEKMAARELHGESLRDDSGVLVSPAGVVAQFKRHLLRFVRGSE